MGSEEKSKSRKSAQRGVAQSQNRHSAPAAPVQEPPAESAWHERAAFQVAFDQLVDAEGQESWQTRAYHEEADGRELWPGIAGEALMNWMRQRADLPSEISAPSQPSAPADEPQPAAQPAAQKPAAEAPTDLRLTIDQLSLEAAVGELELGGGPYESQLDAQVSFHLSGMGAYLATANESSYLIQIMAHDPAQDHMAILALEAQQLHPELLEYSTSLSFDPPPVGEYQIAALVLLPDQAVAATELGPSLTVIPPGADVL